MPTVAQQLCHAREEQQLDIYQVAEITKIKTDHIRALEMGNYNAFSAPVYIRGFVRTYAKALRLDEAKIMADLDAELAQTENFRDHPPLTPPHQGFLDFVMLQFSRLNLRVFLVAVFCLVLIVLVIGWLRNRNTAPEDPLKNLKPGIYQPTQQQSGEMLPLPTNVVPSR